MTSCLNGRVAKVKWPPRDVEVTWDDLLRPSPDLCWQYLRSLRVDPPGLARSGKRAKVFRAALEQSEQLFRAANEVAYPARPILAYYGLAQACLAIMQASPRLQESECSASSHGMKGKLEHGKLLVTDLGSDRGLLTLVRRATDSGGFSSVDLEKLWSTLPEKGRDFSIGLDDSLRPWYFAARAGQEMHISVVDDTLLRHDAKSTLAALLEARPQLSQLSLTPSRGGTNWYSRNGAKGFTIYVHGDASEVDQWLLRNNTYYETTTPRIYASLDGCKAIHPIVSWLSILFLLSKVARYYPERWMEILDINKNAYAPMLENILQRCISVCPALILNTIDHMAVLTAAESKP